MGIKNLFVGQIVTIIVVIAVIIAIGYIGDWYAENNGGISCKLGSGGECGIIGSCDEECDMKEVTLCWVPVFQEEIIEGEK